VPQHTWQCTLDISISACTPRTHNKAEKQEQQQLETQKKKKNCSQFHAGNVAKLLSITQSGHACCLLFFSCPARPLPLPPPTPYAHSPRPLLRRQMYSSSVYSHFPLCCWPETIVLLHFINPAEVKPAPQSVNII